MNLVERVKNILLAPVSEWEKIKNETYTPADLYSKYAVILAAIPAIAGFIGMVVIGQSLGILGTFRWPIGSALTWAVLTYVLALGGAFVFALVMDNLAPSFGGSKDLNTALKVVIFSSTAAWVGGILSIVPSLAMLGMLVGIYSLYLLYLGVKSQMNIPADKLIGFIAVSIIVDLVIVFIAQYLVRAIVFGGSSMALGM